MSKTKSTMSKEEFRKQLDERFAPLVEKSNEEGHPESLSDEDIKKIALRYILLLRERFEGDSPLVSPLDKVEDGEGSTVSFGLAVGLLSRIIEDRKLLESGGKDGSQNG